MHTVISTTLNAGDYCIEATSAVYNDYGTYYLVAYHEEDTGYARGSRPADHAHASLQVPTTTISSSRAPWAGFSTRNAASSSPRPNGLGVVQNSFNLVRFGFTFYNGTSGNEGKMLVGCDNTDQDLLINAMSGIGGQTINSETLDFTQCFPYNGTPTGEALEVAYNYFSQVEPSLHGRRIPNPAFYPYTDKNHRPLLRP